MSKFAIVFGANGYIGRHICLQLQRKNINFLPIGFAKESIDGYPNYLQVDICVPSQLCKVNFDCDFLFLLAGKTGGLESLHDASSYIDINEIGLSNILNHFISGNKRARIIYPSTRVIYEGFESGKLKEGDFKNPKTSYAQSKLNAENIIISFAKWHEINFTIFRICLPFGNELDDSFSYGTIGFFLNQAIRNNEIVIFGDGSQRRTLTHVMDLSRIMIDSCVNTISSRQIYNIGGEEFSIAEIASKIGKQFRAKLIFKPWDSLILSVETGSTVFDDFKLRNDFDVDYLYDLDSWIFSLKLV